MPISALDTLLITFSMGIVTFALRSTPFLVFKKDKEIPGTIKYLGTVLAPASIALLVVYCYTDFSFTKPPYAIPEIIAGLLVVVMHLWKRNMLLSVIAGTAIYMIFVQVLSPAYY